MGAKGTPVAERLFGPGRKLRPSFFQPYRCKNVLIEGVTIVRSPMWEVHPVLSENVTVRNVTVSTHGPNNDGCNPESCRDVLIEGCVFDVGDDCIAIKSGKNDDGRRVNVPSENIVVRGCTFKDGHGGVVLGSECSGHIRNVFVEDCAMDSPNLERMLRFKNNAVRGGILENVFVRNVRVGTVGEAILTIDLLYEEGANGKHLPIVRNVHVRSVTATGAPRVMYVVAFPGAIIDGIRFEDCKFTNVEATEVLAVPGSVEFRNVVIEPKVKPRSLSSRSGPM
jgi:unsaturated rhamnogalacturonyl hydrolase